MARLGLWILGRNTMEVKCPFLASFKGYLPSTGLIAADADLGYLSEAVSLRFSVPELPPTHPAPTHCLCAVLFGGKPLNKWAVYSASFNVKYLHQTPGTLRLRGFVYSLPFTYSIIHINMDSCIFILYVQHCFDFVAHASQPWSLGDDWELFPMAAAPLPEPPPSVWWGFEHPLFLALQGVPGPSSCLSPSVSHFSKASRFLVLGNGVRNQDLGARCDCWYWVPIFFLFCFCFMCPDFPLGPPFSSTHNCYLSSHQIDFFDHFLWTLCSVLSIFIFLALTLLSTTSDADFNSIICYLVFFLVLCTSFSILYHSKPQIHSFSGLSRSYISLFLSILLLCSACFVCPRLGILLIHTQQIYWAN